MKITLIRHYKVKKTFPKKMLIRYAELKEWFKDYEVAEIVNRPIHKGSIEWDICYSSPAKRARETAKSIYRNEPLIIQDLEELNVLELIRIRSRLPFLVWGVIIRNKSLSNNKITFDFKNKIGVFVDSLVSKNEKNVLIVSHGFVMIYLQKELKKRGFIGKGFKSPVNGKAYRYEKLIV